VRIAGQLIGLFSFDIGYEIDLDRARALTESGEAGEMARRRAAPPYLAYATPPLRLRLGTRSVRLGEAVVEATTTAVIHDFGVVTITFRMPLDCEITALPALTATLTGAGPLEDEARIVLEDLFGRVRPAVTNPGLNPFVEDYYVIQTDRIQPPVTIPDWIAQARGPLASALRCEATALSEGEIADVFRTALSYYPDDLVVTEWNVALIVDADYTDAVNVLEYLNVQLLELRYYDALLDRRVAATYGFAATRARAVPLLHRRYQQAIAELAAIRVDLATVFDRVHNALKLSGNLYLAKLYTRTAERLGLRAWEESVASKLDVLHKMYDVFVHRVTTARAEALELAIVILIVVEIVLLLAGWGATP
jgi:hypothetical protein